MSEYTPWWKGAVIYQVYLRSFADSNGDGVGDFQGLISKLDYLAGLGVDALWLSPIHPSPNRDWGYNVSDYDGVHEAFGTLADFETLVAEAHARGLKIVTDEVLAHTSDEHPWFRESLKGGAKADWFVWAPPHEDGTAPNNWLSAFGGEAWSYHPSRRQYYHHKFLRQQPKLNWWQVEACKAALDVLDFWLARGVDGFRLDVAGAYLHDRKLTNNPPVPVGARTSADWAHAPNLQQHIYDSGLHEGIEVLGEIRRTVERYPGKFVFGEFSEEAARAGGFASPDLGLHSGYTFPLLRAHEMGPEFIRAHFDLLARYPAHWPSIAFSNHDVIRTVTRFGRKHPTPDLAKLMLALLLSLKGTALMYQGEELGLPEANLARNQLKDPVGDLYYPVSKGRDGCRTPMPWDSDKPHLGFTTGEPWLPLSPEHRALAVSEQQGDAGSPLNFVRRFIAARKKFPALVWGEISFRDAPFPLLVFERRFQEERVLGVFNMSAQSTDFAPDRNAKSLDIGSGNAEFAGGKLVFEPYGFWLARV